MSSQPVSPVLSHVLCTWWCEHLSLGKRQGSESNHCVRLRKGKNQRRVGGPGAVCLAATGKGLPRGPRSHWGTPEWPGPGVHTGLGDSPGCLPIRSPGLGCPMGANPGPLPPPQAHKQLRSRPPFVLLEVTRSDCFFNLRSDFRLVTWTVWTVSTCVCPAGPLGDLSHGCSTSPKSENSHSCNPSLCRPVWILPVPLTSDSIESSRLSVRFMRRGVRAPPHGCRWAWGVLAEQPPAVGCAALPPVPSPLQDIWLVGETGLCDCVLRIQCFSDCHLEGRDGGRAPW